MDAHATSSTGSSNVHHGFRSLITVSAGYGIVCGLTFPLMISSTFLQEMSLSHGAGNSFGALFFIAYTATMLITAALHVFRRKAEHRLRMATAFGAAFLGNALMLARLLGAIEGGWLYAIVVSGSIGYGLATAELGWIGRISALSREGGPSLARAIPLAYLIGGIAATIIFWASGIMELAFALTIIIVSAVPLIARQELEAAGRRISISEAGVIDFVKAVSYLAVFSFAFGAVSQVAATAETDIIPIQAQAMLGIVVASMIMLGAWFLRKRAVQVSDLYGMLFPIVAIALVALPFVTSPAAHIAATVLVFVAFYLSCMNVRIIVCQLSERDNVSLWVYLGTALGIGGLLILAGVALGARVLAQGSPATGLALISLTSLFVLAMNPVLSTRLERRIQKQADNSEHASQANSPAPENREDPAALLRAFADKHAMTARESEVLALLCQGRTRTYIAAELGLSPNTIKGYIHNVYQKTGSIDKQDLIDRVELYRDRTAL
ncbi:response regulator transcription factor [Paraeggerthella hominis]|uniref:helix-turn-helix transcriptional regulator n=1 Tax=Paraeggerthella hominis TaxID=2897351 RepID=UPI002A86B0E9|nr:helix-turn-helix transcriptional regulator [Paraeggerthella sp.]